MADMGLCLPYVDNPIGRTQVVTSSTRPTGANRYAGLQIYETDTERKLRWDGIGWIIMAEPVQSWTPTFNFGVTVGNASRTGFYHRHDGWCDFGARVILGSTSAVTGLITMDLPLAIFSDPSVLVGLACEMRDAGTATYDGHVIGTGAAGIYAIVASGTYAAVAPTSSTIPFTWTTNDEILLAGTYRMSTQYL